MKKKDIFYYLLAVCCLAACAPQAKEAPTSDSSHSEKHPSSSQVGDKTISLASLNTDEILQGNYDSIIGQWQNPQGEVLTFQTTGLVTEGLSLEGRATRTDGVIEVGLVATDPAVPTRILMVPKDQTIPQTYLDKEEDQTDKSLERMIVTTLPWSHNPDTVYYRLRTSAYNQENPLEVKETGVQLETGPKTVQYANQILGDKDWTVIEGNYTRTESTPYNVLEGNDSSRYTVYQNGFIVNANYQIIYLP